jgi:hypothetical protein
VSRNSRRRDPLVDALVQQHRDGHFGRTYTTVLRQSLHGSLNAHNICYRLGGVWDEEKFDTELEWLAGGEKILTGWWMESGI